MYNITYTLQLHNIYICNCTYCSILQKSKSTLSLGIVKCSVYASKDMICNSLPRLCVCSNILHISNLAKLVIEVIQAERAELLINRIEECALQNISHSYPLSICSVLCYLFISRSESSKSKKLRALNPSMFSSKKLR